MLGLSKKRDQRIKGNGHEAVKLAQDSRMAGPLVALPLSRHFRAAGVGRGPSMEGSGQYKWLLRWCAVFLKPLFSASPVS